MQLYSTEYLQSLMAAIPNVPENADIYARIAQMVAESKVSREPYTFPVTFANLVNTTTAQGSFFVDASSPFMLVQMNYSAAAYPVTVLTEATRMIPNVGITIQEQSSNRNWQSAAVPIPSLFGTAENPGFLSQPRLIPANTTVVMTVNNYDTAQAYNLILSFIGFRLYS